MNQSRPSTTNLFHHGTSKAVMKFFFFIAFCHLFHCICGQSIQTSESNHSPYMHKNSYNIGIGYTKTNLESGDNNSKDSTNEHLRTKWNMKVSNGFHAAQDQLIGRTKDMMQWTAVSHAAENVVEQSTNPKKVKQIQTFIRQHPKKMFKTKFSLTKISKKANKKSLKLGNTVNKAMKKSLKRSIWEKAPPKKKMIKMVPNAVESVMEHSTTKAIVHCAGKNIHKVQNTASHAGTSVLSSSMEHTAEHMMTTQVQKNILKQTTKSIPSNTIKKSTSTIEKSIEKSIERTIASNARRKAVQYQSKYSYPTTIQLQKLKSYFPQKVSKTLNSLKRIRLGRRALTTIPLLGCTFAAHSCVQDGKRSYKEKSKISSILFGIASCLSSIDVFAHLYIAVYVSQLFDMGQDAQIHFALAELLSFWVAVLSIILAVFGEIFSNEKIEKNSNLQQDKEKTIT